MKARDVDRLIGEFASLVGADCVLIVGSQAIHEYIPDPPIDVVVASREVDLIPLPFERYEQWFYYAHERLGADSEFDEANGIYVDMLRASMAKLPVNWESRARERTIAAGSNIVTVVYPELYDLLAAKLIANRSQDEAFLRGVAALQSLDREQLESRIRAIALPEDKDILKERAIGVVGRVFRTVKLERDNDEASRG